MRDVGVRGHCTVLVVLLLAGVTGCAQPGVSAAPADRAGLVARADGVQARLDRVYQRIMGTRAQRVAGDYVSFRLLQDGSRACLAKAGFDYPEAPFIPIELDYPAGLAATGYSWLAPVGSTHLTDSARAIAPAQRRVADRLAGTDPGAERSADLGKPAYGAALSTCDTEVTGYEDADHPAGRDALLGAFHRMLAAADAAAAARAGSYGPCMARSGYSVADYSELAELIGRRLPGLDDIPGPGEPDTAAMGAAVAYEKRAIAADAGCRGDIRARAMVEDLGPALDRFEAAHAEALAAMDRGWAGIVARAAQLPGWEQAVSG